MNSGEATDSVFDAFRQSAERFADRLFLRAPAIATGNYADGAIQLLYRQAAQRVDMIATAYQQNGVDHADRVAVAFDSRLDVYLHLLALNALGASIVPLNVSASDAEIRYIVDHSDCRMVAGADEYLERLRNIAGDLPVIGSKDLEIDSVVVSRRGGGRETEAGLLYTSGTTGKPKGCMLSNEYFLAIGSWYNGLGGICALDERDRLMTPLPPNHMNALATSFMAMMMCGGAVIQIDRFHPSTWWRTAREEGATVIHCLGVMVAMLLTLPEENGDDFSDQIKFCFGPGSDPRHQANFERRFGFPLIEAWAMTETGAGGMTIADKEPRHVGQRCIGKPTRTMDYRLVDEQHSDVNEGEAGELLVRSKGDDHRHMFFSGYYKDQAATDEAWQNGWFHTGDVVRQGEDSSLFFVDRRKNVIRRSGENIAAVEVEAALLQLDEVVNCAVCPVPDEIRGDEVFAFVVVDNSGDDTLARELFDHCLRTLVYFKAPGYLAFVDELPLTVSQKVSRGEVKALALDVLDRHAAYDLRQFKKRRKA